MNVCLKNLSLWRRWMVVYLDDPAGSQALIYLRVLLKCDLDTAVTRSSSPDFSLPLWEIAIRHSISVTALRAVSKSILHYFPVLPGPVDNFVSTKDKSDLISFMSRSKVSATISSLVATVPGGKV
jgi:hypothetical protein